MANSKRQLFIKRRLRVRNKLRRSNAGRMRLSVHRSNKNISAQLIDDVRGVTLASASTLEKDLGVVGKNNVEAAAKVGAAIAERALARAPEDRFSSVAELREAGVEAIIDVRLRNTSQLAGFAKRDDLAFLLHNCSGIAYEHHPELAPVAEILDAFADADVANGRFQFLGHRHIHGGVV